MICSYIDVEPLDDGSYSSASLFDATRLSVCYKSGWTDVLTFDKPKYIQVRKVSRLTVWSQWIFGMPVKVFSNLSMSKGSHVLFGAIDTTARFIEPDYVDGFLGCSVRVFALKVGVQAFGAYGDKDVHWIVLVTFDHTQQTNSTVCMLLNIALWIADNRKAKHGRWWS
jgi:hypothetical protein